MSLIYLVLDTFSARLYSLLYFWQLLSVSLSSKTMNSPTLVFGDSKRHAGSSPSNSDKHPGLRHIDASQSNPATIIYSRMKMGTAVTPTKTKSHRTIIRWWIFSCIAFLVCVPLTSVLLGLHLHARDFQYLDDKSTFDGRTIMFEVILISADPMGSTMTMDWRIIGESQSNCSSTNLEACTDINIFFDNNLLRSRDPTLLRTSDRPASPIFRFNASTFALQDIVANTPTFRTELALFSKGDHHSTPLYYPFDSYSAEICIFARDARTNETLGLRLARTPGIAVGFKTNAFSRLNVEIPPGMVDIIIELSRANLVRTYSIVAIVSIWLITIILLLVMITAVFFGFRQKGEVLVIPVATLFAFTQLRQTMPGAPPGFGDIVDFVGLLPCLALLSLCAAFTLGAFILMDPTDKSQRLSREMWYEAFPGSRPREQAQGIDTDA